MKNGNVHFNFKSIIVQSLEEGPERAYFLVVYWVFLLWLHCFNLNCIYSNGIRKLSRIPSYWKKKNKFHFIHMFLCIRWSLLLDISYIYFFSVFHKIDSMKLKSQTWKNNILSGSEQRTWNNSQPNVYH